jgi:deoxyribose-phosphate aldolase
MCSIVPDRPDRGHCGPASIPDGALAGRYACRYARLVTMSSAPHPTTHDPGAPPGGTTPAGPAGDAFADVTASDAALRRHLHGLPGVDAVGLEARAATLGTRSIKTSSKAYALDLAISMIDLTTLEGADTPGKVRSLCGKGRNPDPTDRTAPPVAAICVYPDMVATAKEALAGSGVHVASVATAFPAGRAALGVKLADTRDAVAAGADEIDMVIDRGAFLSGRYLKVFEEIRAVKQACVREDGGAAHLKVIFENGELTTYDNIRRASWLAMLAGADFIKTSTGKVAVNATLPNTLLMLEAVRDFRAATGTRVGVKPAGGIRTSKDALKYLVTVNETAGEDWLSPDWFRFGASSLLNDLLMQRQKLSTGRYSGPDYVTVD